MSGLMCAGKAPKASNWATAEAITSELALNPGIQIRASCAAPPRRQPPSTRRQGVPPEPSSVGTIEIVALAASSTEAARWPETCSWCGATARLTTTDCRPRSHPSCPFVLPAAAAAAGTPEATPEVTPEAPPEAPPRGHPANEARAIGAVANVHELPDSPFGVTLLEWGMQRGAG